MFTLDKLDRKQIARYDFYVDGIVKGINLVPERQITRVQVDVRIVPFGVVQLRIGGPAPQSPEPQLAPQEEVLYELPHTAGSVTGMIWTKSSTALVL